MQITHVAIYPVKSLGGIALDAAELGPRGLEWDRRWMVVDESGRFVTQRQLPAMARVSVRLEATALVLEHPEAAPLSVPLAPRERPRLEVEIFKQRCPGLDEGEAAAGWLTEVLGRVRGQGLRLVRFPDDHRRAVEPDHLRDGEHAHTGFADGYPLLVANQASLDALNEVLRGKGLAPVPMARFRPNLVVAGAEAFAEDGWESLVAGDGRYHLGLRKPCKRCQIPTVDQSSGEIPQAGEPLQTLIEMKTQPHLKGGYFGQNAILLAGEGETLRVGETLTTN
ncbi:MOSC domain-containing protein [Halomonas sp. 328]|uniref:MOSC domain-containing protein n=1 Tax=Halomonas sp. 328 TaxID=2776704 RepID=UPI0018A72794|nr:MOSC N-terminal beta barrel domain-containing protein [Halomonas sp. 328]MBF8222392.1 MOSC N-terminal beta barrel domain-containing protein [Halomonas sp. 328]